MRDQPVDEYPQAVPLCDSGHEAPRRWFGWLAVPSGRRMRTSPRWQTGGAAGGWRSQPRVARWLARRGGPSYDAASRATANGARASGCATSKIRCATRCATCHLLLGNEQCAHSYARHGAAARERVCGATSVPGSARPGGGYDGMRGVCAWHQKTMRVLATIARPPHRRTNRAMRAVAMRGPKDAARAKSGEVATALDVKRGRSEPEETIDMRLTVHAIRDARKS